MNTDYNRGMGRKMDKRHSSLQDGVRSEKSNCRVRPGSVDMAQNDIM